MNPAALYVRGKRLTGELGALVTILDVRLAHAQVLLQRCETETRVQGVGELSGEHVPAVPVEDGDQIEKALLHGHICDVCAAHLVGPHNG